MIRPMDCASPRQDPVLEKGEAMGVRVLLIGERGSSAQPSHGPSYLWGGGGDPQQAKREGYRCLPCSPNAEVSWADPAKGTVAWFEQVGR